MTHEQLREEWRKYTGGSYEDAANWWLPKLAACSSAKLAKVAEEIEKLKKELSDEEIGYFDDAAIGANGGRNKGLSDSASLVREAMTKKDL